MIDPREWTFYCIPKRHAWVTIKLNPMYNKRFTGKKQMYAY